MADDEVGRNNVLEGEAHNRMGVYTPCTNNVNKKTYGICWVLLISKLHAVLQFVQVWDWWIRGSSSDGRGPASSDSLSGTLYECATPPVHISAGSGDDMPQLLLRSN